MKVYLLVHEFVFGGELDNHIETYATLRAAREAMAKAFAEYKETYDAEYDEDVKNEEDGEYRVDEPAANFAGLTLAGDYNEKRDTWLIVESEVRGVEEFPVAVVMRDDLEFKGFKAKDLNDDTMEVIASKMGDYMLDDVGYWDALVESAEWHGIPHKEEEPEIMVADLAGRIVGWDKWQQVYYLGAGYGHNDGVVYKNQQAFDEHNGICYIPEAGFFDQSGMEEKISEEMQKWLDEQDHCGYVSDGSGGYTRDDLYEAFEDHINYDGWLDEKEKEYGKPFMEEFIDKEIAYIFQELDWQCPSTFMDEMDWEEDWEEFVKDRLDDTRLTDKQAKELGYK